MSVTVLKFGIELEVHQVIRVLLAVLDKAGSFEASEWPGAAAGYDCWKSFFRPVVLTILATADTYLTSTWYVLHYSVYIHKFGVSCLFTSLSSIAIFSLSFHILSAKSHF